MPGKLMNDVWEEDAFSMTSLTATVNNENYVPGQISNSGLFEEDGEITPDIAIEFEDGNLKLVEPTARGGAGETATGEDRELVKFDIPHYQREDSITADEVLKIRALGETNLVENLESRVNKKAGRHSRDLMVTLEHQRIGAIKGHVTTGKGKTIVDLYNKFGVAVPSPVDIAFAAAATKVGQLLQDVVYSLEDDLDAHYTGIHAYTGNDFQKLLWDTPEIRETYLNRPGAEKLLTGTPDVIQFGSITFERYRTGKKAKAANQNTAFIASDEARIVPTGVSDLFLTRFGPSDYLPENEELPAEGVPLYVRQYEAPNGKTRELEIQMNAISICTNPRALRTLKAV